MKKIFIFVPIIALIFCMTPKICSADSHSGEIFFYSGVADEIYVNQGRNLNWYVVKDKIKLNEDGTQVKAWCYAYDENDKCIFNVSGGFIFQVVKSKKTNKYRVIRRITVYEEYLRNNNKFYEYVKKDTMTGALVTVMQRYIDFGRMIPVDIEKERNPFAMRDREREFNGGR